MSESEGRRLERWLRLIFIAVMVLVLISLLQAFSAYNRGGTTEERLRRVEAFVDGQRKFNADLARTLREWAEKEK